MLEKNVKHNYIYIQSFLDQGKHMTTRRTGFFDARDGKLSAAALLSARIASIRIASDAIIDIIITQAAR